MAYLPLDRHIPTTDAVKALQAGLHLAGWEVRNLDIDLVAGRLVVELHRYDGRWVYLAGRADGGAQLERWERRAVVRRYRGGPECDGFEDQFLGRVRTEGIRSGLRSLSTYIADNPCPGRAQLTAPDVRALLAPVLA